MKVNEIKEGLKDPKDNPCWKGYKPVGTKKKGGRTVPNCVPKESVAEGETMSRAAKGNEKYGKDGMKALAKAGREGASDEKLDKIRDKHDTYDEGVAGPKSCWPGHRKIGTQPGTGKNAGKRVNDCEKISERATPEFMETLTKARELLAKGMTVDQVGRQLGAIGPNNQMTGTMGGKWGAINSAKRELDAAKQPANEMRNRRDAYQRDYDSSVSGMGKRQSLAYQLDGGANDEGEQDDPRPQRKSQSRGMYFYNVPADKEHDARIYGLRQTKSGKWYSKEKNSLLDKVFGAGRYWEPKAESTYESVKKEPAKPRNFVAKNAKMGGAGQHKDKKKAEKQGDVKHKKPVYETGELKVQKDDDKFTTLLNPTTGVQTQIDKTNPNSPKLTQDPTGKLKLMTPQATQAGGMPQKPNLTGKSVQVDASPLEDVSNGDTGSRRGDDPVNPHSVIGGDEDHDEITSLLVNKLKQLAGL